MNFLALVIGGILMCLALCCSMVTLAHGGYRTALLTALAASVLAVLCLARPSFRGSTFYRVVAAVLALPALFVWLDFSRRFHF